MNGRCVNVKLFWIPSEDKGNSNVHLEHIEDEILNFGVDGKNEVLSTLYGL